MGFDYTSMIISIRTSMLQLQRGHLNLVPFSLFFFFF